jgi:hypothetical protein
MQVIQVPMLLLHLAWCFPSNFWQNRHMAKNGLSTRKNVYPSQRLAPIPQTIPERVQHGVRGRGSRNRHWQLAAGVDLAEEHSHQGVQGHRLIASTCVLRPRAAMSCPMVAVETMPKPVTSTRVLASAVSGRTSAAFLIRVIERSALSLCIIYLRRFTY